MTTPPHHVVALSGGKDARAFAEWQPIETYPVGECGFPECTDPDCDWGPDVVVLVPTLYGPALYVAHMEAGLWLVRDNVEPGCWGGLPDEPTHWLRLPSDWIGTDRAHVADLERQLAEAKALLVPFVKAHTADLEAVFGGSDVPDSMQLHEEGLTVGDLRRARAYRGT